MTWSRRARALKPSTSGVKRLNARDDPFKGNDAVTRTMWQQETAAAEKYNEPGRFTAFIGFEWTSTPGGNNLHRNVIFRGGKEQADKIIPISQYDTVDPEVLWQWMSDAEKKTGTRLLAIPHNGNLSMGLMFDDVTLTTKKPIDRDYAERRMRWEPLYETTQMKGDGETHPGAFAERRVRQLRALGQEQFRSRDSRRRRCCRANTRAKPSSAA